MLESKSPNMGVFVAAVCPVLCSEMSPERRLEIKKCCFSDSGVKSTPIFELVVSFIGILSFGIEEVVLVDENIELFNF